MEIKNEKEYDSKTHESNRKNECYPSVLYSLTNYNFHINCAVRLNA